LGDLISTQIGDAAEQVRAADVNFSQLSSAKMCAKKHQCGARGRVDAQCGAWTPYQEQSWGGDLIRRMSNRRETRMQHTERAVMSDKITLEISPTTFDLGLPQHRANWEARRFLRPKSRKSRPNLRREKAGSEPSDPACFAKNGVDVWVAISGCRMSLRSCLPS